MIGSTVAVTVGVPLEMSITVPMLCLGLWLVAGQRVSHDRGPEEIHDAERQSWCQLKRPCDKGDTWMLAACRLVEIQFWDREADRRADLLEGHGGVTLWFPAWC